MYARGTMVGLTRGANRNHIIRATLESIAYQSKDVIQAMEEDSGLKLTKLKVDGGATANSFLMQFQSDILGVEVQRPSVTETTALGAAYLAGLAVGFWQSKTFIAENWKVGNDYEPDMKDEKRQKLYGGWKRAVERAKGWEE
jgi:glycerol kinase